MFSLLRFLVLLPGFYSLDEGRRIVALVDSVSVFFFFESEGFRRANILFSYFGGRVFCDSHSPVEGALVQPTGPGKWRRRP